MTIKFNASLTSIQRRPLNGISPASDGLSVARGCPCIPSPHTLGRSQPPNTECLPGRVLHFIYALIDPCLPPAPSVTFVVACIPSHWPRTPPAAATSKHPRAMCGQQSPPETPAPGATATAEAFPCLNGHKAKGRRPWPVASLGLSLPGLLFPAHTPADGTSRHDQMPEASSNSGNRPVHKRPIT